jgi:RimJ/RimL family protein N-acetyltransferase
VIRQLQPEDAEAYHELRRASLAESPLAFVSSPDDDFAASVETVREQLARAPHSVIFGAFAPGLVGALGMYRDRHVKSAHKTHIWGMYVLPVHRRRGLAARLLEATLDHARTLDGVARVQLSVSSAADEARRLYERAGFRVWGTEPDALRDGGRSVVEHHMALRLE